MKAYFKELFFPWKLITFVIGMSFFIVGSFYTKDPTWDVYDSIFMSVLTFLTAPYSWMIFKKAILGKGFKSKTFLLAIFLTMFSASWSYDLYLLWRDGMYPVTWWANILVSVPIYIVAGILWSQKGSFCQLMSEIKHTFKKSANTP